MIEFEIKENEIQTKDKSSHKKKTEKWKQKLTSKKAKFETN